MTVESTTSKFREHLNTPVLIHLNTSASITNTVTKRSTTNSTSKSIIGPTHKSSIEPVLDPAALLEPSTVVASTAPRQISSPCEEQQEDPTKGHAGTPLLSGMHTEELTAAEPTTSVAFLSFSFQLVDSGNATSIIQPFNITVISSLQAGLCAVGDAKSSLCTGSPTNNPVLRTNEGTALQVLMYVKDRSAVGRPMKARITTMLTPGASGSSSCKGCFQGQFTAESQLALATAQLLPAQYRANPPAGIALTYVPKTGYFNSPRTDWNGSLLMNNGTIPDEWDCFQYAAYNGVDPLEFSVDSSQCIVVKNVNDPTVFTLDLATLAQYVNPAVQATGAATTDTLGTGKRFNLV